MIELVCPRCHGALHSIDSRTLQCPQDGLEFGQVDGIWDMLLPERKDYFARFIEEYETVRRLEGRGAQDPEYFRSLPYHSSPAWRIRARSFDALVERLLEPLERSGGHLRILDLGAGNGWLSNRLVGRGHEVTAVDLTVNDFDGLACSRFYQTSFLAVQAEFDCLPFADGYTEMVIFNASLHYSTDYLRTFREALRTLAPGGKIVLLDSPIYRDAESGAQMVREREQQFKRQYGFASNSLLSENYLTWGRVEELVSTLQLTRETVTPAYGLRWAIRPFLARLMGRREPAGFHIIVLSTTA